MRRAMVVLLLVTALLPVVGVQPSAAGPGGGEGREPVARLTARPASGRAPLDVQFDASGSYDPDGGTITAYRWDFDGNGTVDAQGPDATASHTYTQAGVFSARVTVTDDEGSTARKSVQIRVRNTPPAASFSVTFDKVSMQAPLRADFDASASVDTDGSVVSYRWDFDGDGTVDDTSGAVTSHVYDTAGIYLARLVVADNLGATAARAQMITVAANEAPTASFATSPTEGLAAPIEIAFDASASSDPEDGTALTYAWDFEGDGTVDTLDGPATTHVYTAAGVYLPTLTVTDTEGASDTTTQLLLLAGNQAPTVALDTDTSEGVAPASIFFEGTAADADGDTVTLELTPGDGSPTLTPAASVSHTYTTPGVHTAVLTARDPAGAATSVSVQISVAAPPVLVPPAPKAGVVTLVADVAQSLYSGDTPVQTGVEAESLEPAEVAIARGRVLDQAGNPLAGARVSVRDRDDLGVTHSRADGWWDMAVDSGGRLVFDIAKPGYVPNQRTLEPRAGRWEVADETALVPYDTAVTEIDFDAPIEVARGSTVTDDRGTRQQTVLFQQGTEGTVRHTDGTAETLDAMSVRATEITVGPLGKAAMPKLPETVLYNYAVEFYVDEARLAGDDTASIRLSKPAFSYTENFRGFVDGTPVPCGFYNRGTGFWDVCDSGVTVTVLDGTTDSDEDGIGEALLNTDSDADADAGVDIDADGTEDAEIGADEREALAALYSPGTSLWRVRLDHFSTYDFNPGWIMGAAVQPGGDVDGGNDGLDDSCETGGSVIECENQTLGETVAVAGTENTLNYRSSRVPGRVDDYKLEISLLTDGTVPAGVAYACVVVRVAGVEYARRLTPQDADGDGDDDGFTDPDSGCLWDVTGWMEADLSPPSPSLEVTDPGHARFTWDGLDAYGTAVNGVQEAEVKIIYLYPVDCSASSSFGMVSSDGPIYLVGGGCPDYVGISTIVEEEIGHYSNPVDELGGWSLDEHHVYDPATGILNYGTGRFRRLDPGATGSAANYQISTLAEVPTDDDDPYSPWVEGIAVGPDGDIYMADMTGSEGGIWRMNSHGGNVERVAEEMGDLGIWGHGPRDIAYADGNLYIANGELGLRRLDLADHTMVTLNSEEGWGWDPSDYFAGWRAQYLEIHPTSVAVHGDSVFATSEGGDLYRIMLDGEDNEDVADVERIYSGDGTGSYALAVDGGGDVYVGVKNSVLRIDPYGNMSVVAGFWGWCPPGTEPGDGDGGPATEACLGHVSGLAVSDSTLFVADGEDQRIRAVSLETGMISTVAGTGEAGYSGDGGPAVLAEMHSSYNYDNVGGSGVAQHWGIEATDDGLVIADSNNQVIRELTPIFPGVDGDDILVPSEDGSLLFQFDEYGRHEFTLNALTLQTLLNFDYDADGLLTGVTDAFGRRLDIDRPDTQTVTLTSPDGGGHQVTTITRDAAGYADTFGYPGGYTVDVTHGQGATGEGLLGDLTDPAGNYHQYKYDGLGRLVYDYGPDGGYKALVRTPLEPEGGDLDVDYAITLTSLRDTTTSDTATETYTVTRDETGTTRTYTDPTGATTTTVKDPTGTITAGIQADGTTTRTESTGDPRWGMLAPYPMSVDVDVPGRGRQSVDTARSYSYVIESGVVASATQDVTFTDADGAARTVTSEYDWDPDTAEGTVVAGTPEGRTDTMTLDRYGRPVGYDPAPIDGVDQESVAVVYDALGRVDTVSEGSRVTDYDYYTSGESPGDRWEGALKSVTDPTGRTGTVVGYDALLRPLDARNPDGTTSGVRYDDNGNITRVLMPSSGDDHDTHVYDYDSADRPTGHEPPDIQGPDGSTGATWNLDGTPDSAYDADGRSATSTYTPGTGRLDCVDYDSDAAETADVDESRDCTTVPEGAAHLTYTPNDDAHPGYLAGIAGGTSSLVFAYEGTLLDTVEVSGDVTGRIGLGYNGRLELDTFTLDGGTDIAYSYDDDGLLEGAGPLDLALDPQSGALIGSQSGEVAETYSYDEYGALERREVTASGDTLYEQHVTDTDALGRISAVTETLAGNTTSYHYTYTDAGEIDTVTRNGIQIADYAYDDHGNRTCTIDGAPATTEYNVQDQLRTCGTDTYRYTPSGRLADTTDTATGAVTRYSYDDQTGDLAAVGLPDGTAVAYSANVTGDLATRTETDPAGVTVDTDRYLYAGGLQPVAQVAADGTVEAQYVYATAGHVPDLAIVDGATYRLVTDQLGSVRAVVDTATGAVVQTTEYDTWGNTTRQRLYDSDGDLLCDTSTDDCDADLDWQPFGYAGGITDPTTGLVHFGARWYDPGLGRWITKDPIGQAGGLNVYTYAANDPVNYIDPTGLVGWGLLEKAKDILSGKDRTAPRGKWEGRDHPEYTGWDKYNGPGGTESGNRFLVSPDRKRVVFTENHYTTIKKGGSAWRRMLGRLSVGLVVVTIASAASRTAAAAETGGLKGALCQGLEEAKSAATDAVMGNPVSVGTQVALNAMEGPVSDLGHAIFDGYADRINRQVGE